MSENEDASGLTSSGEVCIKSDTLGDELKVDKVESDVGLAVAVNSSELLTDSSKQ